MNLLIKAKRDGNEIAAITPESAGWQYVGFAAYRICREEKLMLPALSSRESCLIVLTGTINVEAGDLKWEELGSRQSVFEDVPPGALYLPPGLSIAITAVTDAEIGLASAPAQAIWGPRLINPQSMHRSVRGKGSNLRYVRDILSEKENAESLLVVEVRTPSGHSSSYPPHKHDMDNLPAESLLEETYYHRIHPSQGFVFQRIYTESRDVDTSLSIEDRDVVLVPRGYHPVVVPHGYESYYLNVMAGPKRIWRFHNDPSHEWILNGVT